ncbi:MAG: hypothetical protein AAB853_04465, partial [Patescibacteria group bacterium]
MILRKSILATLLLILTMAPTIATTVRGFDVQDDTSLTTLFSIPKAYAQSATTGSSPIEVTAMKFFTKFLEVFVVLNWVALSGVEALLDPDFIFGAIPVDDKGVPTGAPRPMETVLHGLWLLSRNITNAIFAFILLAGGIYLILNAGGEGISKIKQMAPKFVLAVILVNFSWFFPRVIIDAANVMSAVIYQLPSLTTGNVCISDRKPGEDGFLHTGDDITTSCSFVW